MFAEDNDSILYLECFEVICFYVRYVNNRTADLIFAASQQNEFDNMIKMKARILEWRKHALHHIVSFFLKAFNYVTILKIHSH
jgi:hypothetical protein